MRSRKTPRQLNGPIENLLLVEGDDDYNTVKHLLIKFGLSPEEDQYVCRVRETEGYPQVLDRLQDAARESGLLRLGIVLDADTDINARWKSITNSLGKIEGFEKRFEKAPTPGGAIVDVPNKLRIGVWLMPDNENPGALEEFAHRLLPATDKLWPHVDTSIKDLPVQLFTDSHLMKAKLNTWLAWQKYPGKPIGIAVYERWLNPEAPQCLTFKAWLEKLFDLTPESS